MTAEKTTMSEASAIRQLGQAREKILQQLSEVIVGQHEVIEELLISLFSRGHCLLEGVPGFRVDDNTNLGLLWLTVATPWVAVVCGGRRVGWKFCLGALGQHSNVMNMIALLAANICTSPLRVDAWPPLLAKFAGTLRMPGTLGSMERNDPSCPKPVSGGAPKFD